ncbi:hypothetical protein FOA43_000059 [Brettanomyces nanus]|uniref:PCI domain-containing protein n=1 Tax=Eeniella nana TaxID=13502 RepID=A0A875RWD5_EENNA|nr:uncharacterized protein FOA43_000059 [Brettanomyces nanus]QPG72758.1 hypothetical protein FOA43_000059 [Brettanomyces nanus]
MAFSIVLNRYINESVAEYGAILDFELKEVDNKYQKSYEELLKNDDKQELLNQIVGSSKFLLVNFSDKSLEPTANLYIHILDALTSELNIDISGVFKQVLTNFSSESLSKSAEIKPTTVISLLSNIFNFLKESNHLRADILKDIITLVSANDLQSMLLPIAQNFSVWLSDIEGVTDDEWRALANQIFAQIYAQDQMAALTFYKKLVESETDSSKLQPQDYDEFLVKVLSSKKYFNVCNLDIGAKLGDGSLAHLFEIIRNADLSEFLTFVNSKEGSKLGDKLDLAKLTYKVKYLAAPQVLEKFEEETGKNEFSYEQIAQQLDVPSDSIEEFLINCIQQGLITGRLSQAKQVFYLSKIDRLNTPSKTLNAKDWHRANQYLENWSRTIEDLQSLIKNLTSRKGKKMLPPQAIQTFHQQKQELKEHLQQEKQKERERHQDDEETEDSQEPAVQQIVA